MSSTLPIERARHLSLDERLRSARGAGQNYGGWQAPLESVPSKVVVLYRDGRDVGEGAELEMHLEFVGSGDESFQLVSANSDAQEKVEVAFGTRSGRVYKVVMRGVQLNRNSAEHFAEGMLRCVKRLATGSDPTKAATALATYDLLRKVLASQVEEIRRQTG